MKVSLIVPCYNAGKYLSECLESVLSQTERDFEAILVDDGSSDDTARIAEAYCEKDGRLKAVHQPNGGVCSARNHGLSLARGEWIFFLDADDVLPADALETLLKLADDKTDLVVGTHAEFSENGKTMPILPDSGWVFLRGEKQRRAAVLRLIEGDSVLNTMCNKLHRRACLEQNGLRLTEGLKIAEDALFNLEAVLCGQGIRWTRKTTYLYRMHDASATHTRPRSEWDAHVPWLNALGDVLSRRGILEREWAAYFDSAVLRLYKDGGVSGVLKEFKAKAMPMLAEHPVRRDRLFGRARFLYDMSRRGLYEWVYPFEWFFGTILRKGRETVARLRFR